MVVKVILGALTLILHIILLSVMLVLERDKPRKLIFWSLCFIFTSVFGGVVYAILKLLEYKKRSCLMIKIKEDEIYKRLISNELYQEEYTPQENISIFASDFYNARLTKKNSCEIINTTSKLDEILSRDANSSTKKILIQVNGINFKDFPKFKETLIKKAQNGTVVKYIYENRTDLKTLKELKFSGIKCYRFSKFYKFSKQYYNNRNVIVFDGNVAYFGNFNSKTCGQNAKYTSTCAFLRLKGEIVQEIDITLRQDIIFASGKYIEYEAPQKLLPDLECSMQYVANGLNHNLEWLIVKAISDAKQSIQLELGEFIPTDSISSLLKLALNSNIDVRLIIPMQSDSQDKVFATRAYAKELALAGANVYLYDGKINFNSIIIDNKYMMFGNYTINSVHLMNNIQNILIIQDEKIISSFNKKFDLAINNSYRINDAKFMLLREKIFKNLV